MILIVSHGEKNHIHLFASDHIDLFFKCAIQEQLSSEQKGSATADEDVILWNNHIFFQNLRCNWDIMFKISKMVTTKY